jgi:hypothetical protein
MTRKDGERASDTHSLESVQEQVRTQKESPRPRDTHFLESEGGRTSHDMESN